MIQHQLDEGDEQLQCYLAELKQKCFKGKNGAIVMNCNPLTYGHKMLIDYAAKSVEHLYIFVVEEDRSAFSFDERFRMVSACAASHSNITVLPSSSYILSMGTFPGDFTKKTEQLLTKGYETTVDTSLDVTIFGKYIAPALNIKTRFVGEEPTDYITAQYNLSMKRILPDYGVEIVEIPRYEMAGVGIISATKVRQAISEGDWERVRILVPETTYHILEEKYLC